MNNSFKQYLESQGKSKSTVSHYTRYILDFISYLDRDNTEPENATAKEVLAYLAYLQNKGQGNKTRSIRLGVIKHFFNWQVAQSHRVDNPVSHVKIRGTKQLKLYRILDRQQLDSIYYNYVVPSEKDDRSNCNWFTTYRLAKGRNKTILSLLVNQGLTTAQVAKLRLGDLKLRQGEIHIQGDRNSNARSLELKSSQVMELMEYTSQIRPQLLTYQGQETDLLFLAVPALGKQQASKSGSLQIWKSLTKEICKHHPEFINFKQVRASVITHWLKQYNLRQVQYMAGHRYVSSTESYLVNNTEELQADIDQFHPLE